MRKRRIALVFALFLGTFGAHRFYLGQTFLGILYAVFFSTGIPTILGIIDAIVFMGMSDEDFDRKYNKSTNKKEKYDRAYNREAYKSVTEQHYKPERTTVIQRKPKAVNQELENLKKEALKLYREFRYVESIEKFESALVLKPKDPSIHFNLACAYSLVENAPKSFFHLAQAVQNGFRETDKISTHEALSYLRIQPGFESFRNSSFQELPPDNNEEQVDISEQHIPELGEAQKEQDLLEELRQLERLKLLGVLSEKEYEEQKKQLSS